MPDIVISEFMDKTAVARLRSRFETAYDPELVDRREELVDLAREARALIVRNRTQVRGGLLGAAQRLECVGRLGVGLDDIDAAACAARGIAVYPATGANNLSVVEYVMTAALMLLRGAFLSSRAVAAGEWPREPLIGRELAGRTLGLVGYGAIAQEVAWRARDWGMSIAAHDPFLEAGHPAWRIARNLSLDELIEVSDVISLHVPLTEQTANVISAARIATMKPDAILINTARGGVLDEAALADALRAGRIGGAALDVFETEPLTGEAARRFERLDNLILTPHIAGVTRESNVRVSALVADRVTAHLEKG